MAGQLIQVATNTVTSAVSSINLSGIDDNSTYLFTATNTDVSVDNSSILLRVIKASDSSADTTSNYDNAYKNMSASFSFTNQSNTNMSSFQFLGGSGTGTNESGVGILYLFNWFDSSEYSFMTWESALYNQTPALFGANGGQVHTVAQSNNGIQIFMSSGNITSGTFTLFRCV
jgi:hypothetical protein